jgi:transmembrane sensor
MTEFELLISRYLDGTISPAEKLKLFEMIGDDHAINHNSEHYTQYVQLLNETSAAENRKDQHFQLQLNEIRSRLEMHVPLPENRVRVMQWKWYAAASVIVLIGFAYWLFHRPEKQSGIVKLDRVPPTYYYRNDKNVVLDSLLPDGSAVVLYPGSALNFTGEYNKGKRDIHMTGKILFTVFKDLKTPFTVYAGGFSTTALGTEFEVNASASNKFSVKLLKGKIFVRSTETTLNPMTDVYLKPGESLTYDLRLKTPLIEGMENEKENEKRRNGKNRIKNAVPEFSFSDLPLNILFGQLEKEYGIIISCDDKLISGKTYSGTFRETDDPDKVLDQIVKKCHLQVHKEGNVYQIE